MIEGCKYDVIETGQTFCNSVELAEAPLNITKSRNMVNYHRYTIKW
jgi:hypothetical protein